MDITVNLFDKICRVCLMQSSNLKSLFLMLDGVERNLFEILSFTANISMKYDDRLPKQICRDCETTLHEADAFKKRCLDSEALLNNVYENFIRLHNNYSEPRSDRVKLEKMESEDGFGIYTHLGNGKTSISGYQAQELIKNSEEKSNLTSIDAVFSKKCKTLPLEYNQVNKNDEEHNYDDNIDYSLTNYHDNESRDIAIEFETQDQAKPLNCHCGTTFNSNHTCKVHLQEKSCNKYKKNSKKITKVQDIIILNNKSKKKSFKQDSIQEKPILKKCNKRLKVISEEDLKLYQCELCFRKFKTKTALDAHTQKHKQTENIKHICEICKREFKYKAYLENHIVQTHKKSTNNCDLCGLSFVDQNSLEIHKETHNDKKHRCHVCNKGFGMLCTLKEHIRTHTGEKPFLCSQCGKGFSQKTNLAQHMRRHQGLKPFKCETCEKRFVSKGELDAHSRKHSGAHPFVCDDCGNGFTTASALKKHRRTHTGEKPYLCDLCPMRFAASGTLKNHRRIHTGERPFQCSYCDKAFVQRNDLISHIRCHTGEKPYICSQCGQSFRKASGLKTHVKMHVKEPVAMLHGVNLLLSGMQCSEQ